MILLIASFLTVATIKTGPALGTSAFGPLDRPGPALSVAPAALAKSLTCSPGWATSPRRPVLLLSGTTINPMTEFSWNWIPALDAQHIPWCASTALPKLQNSGDITVRAQYVVHAIRTMHAASGKRIAIIGHSQGGMVPRWALRFWPDTRAKVADVVAISPSNHGTRSPLRDTCRLACITALWQQSEGSKFLAALNSGRETFPGIDYTVIYSDLDEVVTPGKLGALRSDGGTVRNIAVQDICPLSLAEHLATGSFDPVAYHLGLDALLHAGPANPARISRSVCSELVMPYTNPLTAPISALSSGLSIAYGALLAAPLVTREPALPCYVYSAGC